MPAFSSDALEGGTSPHFLSRGGSDDGSSTSMGSFDSIPSAAMTPEQQVMAKESAAATLKLEELVEEKIAQVMPCGTK
jgi:hypothetical protein